MTHRSVASARVPARSSATTVALLAAHDRLRNGQATITDGKVSVVNVAREAGVSRATAYRCIELLSLFERVPKAGVDESKAARSQSGDRELRAAVRQLLSRIIVLEALLETRDSEIARLRALLKPNGR
jgi:hypothetical protein